MQKMPSQISTNNSAANEIKVKTAYSGEITFTYIDGAITYEKLCEEMRVICRFPQDQPFTIKWVDEENDPCTISTQMELDEAIRLYEVNRDSELTLHGNDRAECLYDFIINANWATYSHVYSPALRITGAGSKSWM